MLAALVRRRYTLPLMAAIDKHPAGNFCWVELATSDQAAAKDFYTRLFGWTVNEIPMGPTDSYTIFELDGLAAAAAYTMQPAQRSGGIPSHWMMYIAVDNVDASAARAAQLGGEVIDQPMDVFDAGRMAVIRDPTGGVFALWQAHKHIGSRIAQVPGALCWADLNTPDPQRASEFYSQLFGWKLETAEKDASGYLHIKNGEHFIGGIQPASQRNPGAPPHWLAYVLSNDCDATAVAAKKMGAKFYLPPMTMEGVGRMAVVSDPQGAVFAIFQPTRHA